MFAAYSATIECNSVRREDALESDQMLGVAIHQRAIEIEQERGFHDAPGREARHALPSHRRSDLPGREFRVAIAQELRLRPFA